MRLGLIVLLLALAVVGVLVKKNLNAEKEALGTALESAEQISGQKLDIPLDRNANLAEQTQAIQRAVQEQMRNAPAQRSSDWDE